MPTVSTDPKLLAGFVPMNALSANISAASQARPWSSRGRSDRCLFQEGSSDHDSFYVLDGEVQLVSKKTAPAGW